MRKIRIEGKRVIEEIASVIANSLNEAYPDGLSDPGDIEIVVTARNTPVISVSWYGTGWDADQGFTTKVEDRLRKAAKAFG